MQFAILVHGNKSVTSDWSYSGTFSFVKGLKLNQLGVYKNAFSKFHELCVKVAVAHC